ncbi:hypothetical protein NDN01_24665 [Sphingomonas sp. QA11]|uniref:hypothetical protein n=1 Tax=Sphingomonas sp. QA11 TaxID=2950605 RepID=UPI00234BE536|nr:hypothetical protein [Sphingomonas sp. QA11]WCM27136.1 hypothetical protein NDN01_24665 [Sphingomonas sp. QA11]
MQILIEADAGDSLEGIWDQEAQRLKIRVMRDSKPVSARGITETTFYEGTGRRKFIHETMFGKSSDFTVDPNETLRLYHQVWAVDTNSKPGFGGIMNVTGVSVVATDGSNVIAPVAVLFFGRTAGKAELCGWRRFIDVALSNPRYDAGHRYALIVDADYPNLADFNHRRRPIHGDFYLPDNFTLIYATADKPDSILNRALKMSDIVATKYRERALRLPRNAAYFADVLDEETHQVAVGLIQPE